MSAFRWLIFLLWTLPAVAGARGSEPPPSPTPDPVGGMVASLTWLIESAMALDPDRELPETLLQRLEDLADRHPEDLRPRLALARIQTDAGLLKEAEIHLTEALEREPALMEALWLRGGLAVRQHDMHAAADYYARAVETGEAGAVQHFDLATVLVLFRKELTGERFGITPTAVMHSAIDHYRRATELAPEHLEYRRALAETYYLLQPPDWPAARAAWFELYQRSPTPALVAVHLARVCIQEKRYAEAEWWLDRIESEVSPGLMQKLREKLPRGKSGAAR